MRDIETIVHEWIHGGAWDRESVENTAELGLAEADRERLEEMYPEDWEEIGNAIVAACRDMVEDS